MSKPTDRYEDEAWWRAARVGEKPPVHDGDPNVGWFKYKKFKGGPWVPVIVWRHGPTDEAGDLIGDEQLYAMEDGNRAVDPSIKWTWYCQYPITTKEYQALIDGPKNPETYPDIQKHPETPTRSLAEADPVF